MSTDRFSKAARLYAANEAVVNEMWRRLKSDIGEFWKAAATEVGARIAPTEIEIDKLTDAAPYTYLHATNGRTRIAALWVHRDDCRVVRDAKVLVGFGLPRASDPAVMVEAQKLSALIPTSIGTMRKIAKPSAATLFQFDLALLVVDRDPVDVFAEAVAPTLGQLVVLGDERRGG
jgi:hypothetical protein